MVLSKKQEIAIERIKEIKGEFGVRWFIQAELTGITLHTMKALVEKGYLEEKVFDDMFYYRWRGKE